jgi:hypothetical protein
LASERALGRNCLELKLQARTGAQGAEPRPRFRKASLSETAGRSPASCPGIGALRINWEFPYLVHEIVDALLPLGHLLFREADFIPDRS